MPKKQALRTQISSERAIKISMRNVPTIRYKGSFKIKHAQ